MKPEVLLYVTSWCPYCRRAKALLTKKGVPFKEVDLPPKRWTGLSRSAFSLGWADVAQG